MIERVKHTQIDSFCVCVLHRFSTEEAKERPLSIYQIFYQSGFVQFLIIIMKKKMKTRELEMFSQK